MYVIRETLNSDRAAPNAKPPAGGFAFNKIIRSLLLRLILRVARILLERGIIRQGVAVKRPEQFVRFGRGDGGVFIYILISHPPQIIPSFAFEGKLKKTFLQDRFLRVLVDRLVRISLHGRVIGSPVGPGPDKIDLL